MCYQQEIEQLAVQLGTVLLAHKLYCTVAESCTGGSLAAAITAVPGCSQWFDRGFVTYTNQAKVDMLAVANTVLTNYGAVSGETVCAMAEGAIVASEAQIGVAISGIAGPGGGGEEKPVGTVWIAWAGKNFVTESQCFLFEGDRTIIRQQAVKAALQGLILRGNNKSKKS